MKALQTATREAIELLQAMVEEVRRSAARRRRRPPSGPLQQHAGEGVGGLNSYSPESLSA